MTESCDYLRVRVPSRGTRKYKDHETGMFLRCAGERKEDSVVVFRRVNRQGEDMRLAWG